MKEKNKSIRFEITADQWRAFRKVLKYTLEHNKFYKAKLRETGIRTLSQIKVKDNYFKLPFLTKKELVADQKKNPPFGNHASSANEDFYYVRTTSGTSTGRAHVLPFTLKDHYGNVNLSVTYQLQLGVKKSDRYYGVFAPGTSLAILEALNRIGALGIAYNMNPASQILEILKDTKATIFHGSTGMLLHLIDVAEQEKFNLKNLHLRLVVAMGEIITPVTHQRIEKFFGVPCTAGFFSTEIGSIGYKCPTSGHEVLYHHMPSGSILEVIDPKTKRHAIKGEMVLTALTRYDYPFVRYRTGNLIELVNKRCKCGNPGLLFKTLGRSDNTIRFRNQYFMPSQFEAILRNFEEIKDFRIELKSEFGSEFMILKIIPRSVRYGVLSKKIKSAFWDKFGLKPTIEIAPEEFFTKSMWKTTYFTDLRYLKDRKIAHSESNPANIKKIYRLFYYRVIKPLTD